MIKTVRNPFAKTGKPFEISLAKVTLQYLYVAFNYYKIHYICATTLRFTTH